MHKPGNSHLLSEFQVLLSMYSANMFVQLGAWGCSNCTFANGADCPACPMCDAVHPDVARQQNRLLGLDAHEQQRGDELQSDLAARAEGAVVFRPACPTSCLANGDADASSDTDDESLSVARHEDDGDCPICLETIAPGTASIRACGHRVLDWRVDTALGKRKRDLEAKCGDMSHGLRVLDVGSPRFMSLWKDYGKVAQSLAFEWCEYSETLEAARGPATARQPQVLILNSSSWLEYSTLREHGGPQPARARPTPAHGRAARTHCCPRPRTLSPQPRTRTR